jgi:hypothetical protein
MGTWRVVGLARDCLEGVGEMGVFKTLIGNRGVRGISSMAAIIIAVAVVLIFSSTIMWLLHFAVDTLWLVLKIGVLVLLVLIVAGWIKSSSKKVS